MVLPVLVFIAVWLLHRKALARTRKGPSSVAVGAGLFLWLWSTAGVGLSGVLGHFELRPPPFGILMLAVLVASFSFAFSRIGATLASLPLSWLIALQGFRLPLELVMHRASVEGVMPVQMSYSGWNFDIATGAAALILAPAVAKGLAPRWVIVAWNAVGAVLLANVVTIAFLSSPILRAFGSGPGEVNTFVAFFPYVWLPAALVSTALAFHVIVARALWRGSAPSA